MTKEERMAMVQAMAGNAEKYDVANIEVEENSVLKGKKIIYLGSSVTFGAASLEQSFVEVLEKKCGVQPWKEAVSGTTLVNDKNDGQSYVERMLTIDPSWPADAFVCQLSTNDATKKKPIGALADNGEYDVTTIAGAMEHIIDYARRTWNCPVFFYTGTKYDSAEYQAMVDLLMQIKEKHGIEVIDLWNNPKLLAVSAEDYQLYMADPIHPTKAGYVVWWTPEIEKDLKAYFTK